MNPAASSADPQVSICLPNLNQREFLKERIDSILGQSFTDWELIVADSFSTDGSWEYLQERLGKDPRCTLFQLPPGLYDAWNACLRQCTGEYIYIAPADDTMSRGCLQSMVEALDEHPDCDIAHCNLTVIDAAGHPIDGFYRDKCDVARYFGELLDQTHIRKAPHDGLLHYLGSSVYVSLTQLLIRKSLFDRIGLFRNDLGSAADFEWGMRAGLTANTIHIPAALASWRIHQQQVTSFENLQSVQSTLRLLQMTRIARSSVGHPTADLNDCRHLNFEKPLIMQAISQDLNPTRSIIEKGFKAGKWFFRAPFCLVHHLGLRITRRHFDPVRWVRTQFARHNLNHLISRL